MAVTDTSLTSSRILTNTSSLADTNVGHAPVSQTLQTVALVDRELSSDRVDTSAPATTSSPTDGRTLPTAGEPAGLAGDTAKVSSAWQTVFGGQPNGQATNHLMNEVSVIKATQKDENLQERGSQRAAAGPSRPFTSSAAGVTSSSVTADVIDVSNKLPAGALTANADGSITTPGGYTVFNDGNHQWRVQEPDGTTHRIWGDPHVDEDNDGQTDWHFDTDASFILPDGSKIFCDTDKVSEFGGKDVTTSDTLKIQYLDSLGTMDVANGGPGSVSTGGAAYDNSHSDGDIFVLADGHHFVDGATLGDLYDAGGDYAVDVNGSSTGSVSDLALITLQNSLAIRDTTLGDVSGRTSLQSNSGAQQASLSDMVANVYANLSNEDGERGRGRSPAQNAGRQSGNSSTLKSSTNALTDRTGTLVESLSENDEHHRTTGVRGSS